MRPFTSTIPFADALERVLSAAAPIDRTVTLSLVDADGRVAASDVVSAVDVPAFDRAAMDGYAVVADDTSGASAAQPASLRCVDRVFTGQVSARTLRRGECMEIATGAPLPAGADAVSMVEDTERGSSDAEIRIRTAVQPRQHVGRRGADVSVGDTVVSAGHVLNPSRIGALAATGGVGVVVYDRPRVAIITTGNEVADPGQPLTAGQVYDVNRYTLATVVARHGGEPIALPNVGDRVEDLAEALDAAVTHDMVVFSGGSSVGERDLVLDALRRRGEVLFHGVAVKPGKPTAFARVAGKPVFGMPGYPTSCLSNAYMLLVPFLRRVARLPEWVPRTVDAPLTRRITSAPGRHQFYTVRLVDGRAEPAFKASGDITSMANADGFIEIAADTDSVEQGTMVTVKLF